MRRILSAIMTILLALVFNLALIELSLAQEREIPSSAAYEALGCPAKLGNEQQSSLQPSDEIIVLLTERIDPPETGVTASCSEIIECLRILFRGVKDKNSNDDISEQLALTNLKNNFPSCVISGTDGLDLLNNYAATVYQWIAGIVGAICVLVIIVSGIQISIGGLSQEEISSAKDRIFRSLAGLVVLFLSAFILYTINPIFFT